MTPAQPTPEERVDDLQHYMEACSRLKAERDALLTRQSQERAEPVETKLRVAIRAERGVFDRDPILTATALGRAYRELAAEYDRVVTALEAIAQNGSRDWDGQGCAYHAEDALAASPGKGAEGEAADE